MEQESKGRRIKEQADSKIGVARRSDLASEFSSAYRWAI